MPDLDVSDILLDPDFAETITVNRTTQVVSSLGVVSNTITAYSKVAVVTIGPLHDVLRTPDYELANNIITVHIRGFRLIGPEPGYQPDVVVWGGDNYVVKKSYNWSHYGAGFTAAECELTATVTTS